MANQMCRSKFNLVPESIKLLIILSTQVSVSQMTYGNNV